MAEAAAAPAESPPAPAPKGKGGLVLGVLSILVALGAGAGGAWWWWHTHAAPTAEVAVQPPLYLALDPPFVVNFESEQLVRFLQITVQFMSRDPATLELLKANDPAVRNELLLLFSNQKYASLSTREGKEALRADALDTARKVIGTAGGKPERLEAVYFTSFVMQ